MNAGRKNMLTNRLEDLKNLFRESMSLNLKFITGEIETMEWPMYYDDVDSREEAFNTPFDYVMKMIREY